MTLEQRVEALEKEIAHLKKQLSEATDTLSCFQSQILANMEQISQEMPVQ